MDALNQQSFRTTSEGHRGHAARTALVPSPDADPAAPTEPDEPSPQLHWRFPATALHAHHARAWFDSWLGTLWGEEADATFRANLAFAEIVANGVIHGRGPITIDAALTDDTLRCEVSDTAEALPYLRDADTDTEHGRGLHLVDAVVDQWSTNAPHGTTGKTVWFTIHSAA